MQELSYGIKETLDKLFAGVLVGGITNQEEKFILHKKETFKQNLPRFLDRFVYNIFEQEYAVLYEVINSVHGGVFSLKQLDAILDNNTDIILKSKYITFSDVNLATGVILTDEEKYILFKDKVLNKFVELSNIIVDVEDYKSCVDIYIDWYVNELALKTAQDMTIIMGEDGLSIKDLNGRKKYYKGLADYKKYYSEQEKVWTSLKEKKGQQDILIDENWLQNDLDNYDKPSEEEVLRTGLDPIDNSITAVLRGHLVNIVGQTKGGKTRFTNYLVGKLLSEGYNVAVWALEGSINEWLACQTSYIIFDKYAKDVFKEGKYVATDESSGVVVVDSSRVLKGKFDNKVEKEAVIAAKTELSTSAKRGKLSFINSTCYIEDFLDKIDAHYENINQFDVIVMDSPLLIQSKTGIAERERITNAFIQLKAYITSKHRKLVGITTSQLKQEVIDELRRNPKKEMDVTAAGGTSEAIRSPDEVWGLFSSKESRNMGQVTIESIASRHHDNFPKFICSTSLGSCYFTYREDIQKIT